MSRIRLTARVAAEKEKELDETNYHYMFSQQVPFPKYSGSIPQGLKNVARHYHSQGGGYVVISDVFTVEGLPTIFVRPANINVINHYIAIPEKYDTDDEEKIAEAGIHEFIGSDDNVLGFTTGDAKIPWQEKRKDAFRSAVSNAKDINKAIANNTFPLKSKKASIVERLDKIAAEVERVDPRLALALDRVSDSLEQTPGRNQ